MQARSAACLLAQPMLNSPATCQTQVSTWWFEPTAGPIEGPAAHRPSGLTATAWQQWAPSVRDSWQVSQPPQVSTSATPRLPQPTSCSSPGSDVRCTCSCAAANAYVTDHSAHQGESKHACLAAQGRMMQQEARNSIARNLGRVQQQSLYASKHEVNMPHGRQYELDR